MPNLLHRAARVFASGTLVFSISGCIAGEPALHARDRLTATAPIAEDSGSITVPHFSTSFVYNGTTYGVKMVGTNPSGGGTTVVASEIVPLALTFADGTTLDATPETPHLIASPIYANAVFEAGTTQFGDAVMRSEFWTEPGIGTYHVLLSSPVIEPTISLQVRGADGYTKTLPKGAKVGYVDFAWLIDTIEPQILAQLSVDPTTLALFETESTYVLEPGGHCCFEGYHSAFKMSSPLGPATYTTAWASVSAASVKSMSHEVAEWMNDPLYTNAVPGWVNPFGSGCGGHKLEVGDPVARYSEYVNGFQIADVAFYSWFTRTSPSIAIDAAYDLKGVLTVPAAVCP